MTTTLPPRVALLLIALVPVLVPWPVRRVPAARHSALVAALSAASAAAEAIGLGFIPA